MSKLKRLKSPNVGPRLRPYFKLSRKHLFIYALIFAVIGAAILIFTFAASPQTKVWDTDNDFNTGTTKTNVSVSGTGAAAKVELSRSTAAINTPLHTYEIHAQPYNFDSSGISPGTPEWDSQISRGQQSYWHKYTSPTVSRDIRVNGQGNAVVPPTSNYTDDMWFAWEDYIPSSYPTDSSAQGSFKNFHISPKDLVWQKGITLDPVTGKYINTPGISGVSSLHVYFNTSTNNYELCILCGYSDPHKKVPVIFQPTRDTWHSFVMHVIWGRAENGVTPKKGRIQVWANGKDTPAVDTDTLYGPISTIARFQSGSPYAGQLEQYVDLWEGGPYTLNYKGSKTIIHQSVAMRVGKTLAEALADKPTLLDKWGTILIPGSPIIEPGHPDSYSKDLPSRNASQFQLPPSLASQAGLNSDAYLTSGSITLPFDAGAKADWGTATPVANLPTGTNISYEYRSSPDKTASSWSPFTTDINAVPNNRYIEVKVNLSTTNTANTPSLDKLSLTYRYETQTKVWDTKADFDEPSNTKDNITTNTNGTLNLTPSGGESNGSGGVTNSISPSSNSVVTINPSNTYYVLPKYWLGGKMVAYSTDIIDDRFQGGAAPRTTDGKTFNQLILESGLDSISQSMVLQGTPSNPNVNWDYVLKLQRLMARGGTVNGVTYPGGAGVSPHFMMGVDTSPLATRTAPESQPANRAPAGNEGSRENIKAWIDQYVNEFGLDKIMSVEFYNEPATMNNRQLGFSGKNWYSYNDFTNADRKAADFAINGHRVVDDFVRAAYPALRTYGSSYAEGAGNQAYQQTEIDRFIGGYSGWAWGNDKNTAHMSGLSTHGYGNAITNGLPGAPGGAPQSIYNSIFYPDTSTPSNPQITQGKSGYKAFQNYARSRLDFHGGTNLKMLQSEWWAYKSASTLPPEGSRNAMGDILGVIVSAQNAGSWKQGGFIIHAINAGPFSNNSISPEDLMFGVGSGRLWRTQRYFAIRDMLAPFVNRDANKRLVSASVSSPASPGGVAGNPVAAIQTAVALNDANNSMKILAANIDMVSSRSVQFRLGTAGQGTIRGKYLPSNLAVDTALPSLPAIPYDDPTNTSFTYTLGPGEAAFFDLAINPPAGSPPTTYTSPGSITLSHDAGAVSDWTGVTPVVNKPAGTDVVFQYRSSPDKTNSSLWSPFTSDINAVPDGRYLEIKATLSTTNNTVTPSLDKITLVYEPLAPPAQTPGGTVPVHDSQVSNTRFFGISGTQSDSKDITVADKPDRMLLFGFTRESRAGCTNLDSVTYNGKPLTKLTTAGDVNATRVELWYLLNPDIGTHTLTANAAAGGTSSCNARWGASAYYGVKQVAPTNIYNSNLQATSITSATNSLANTKANSLIVDLLAGSGGSLTTVNPDSGQTTSFSVTDRPGAGTGYGNATSTYKASSGGAVTTKQTTAAGNFTSWAYIQVELEAVAAEPPPPPPPPDFIITDTNIRDGASIATGATWSVSFNAVPDKVEFWADGTKLGEDISAPFEQALNLATGTRLINVCAWSGATRDCDMPSPGSVWAHITVTPPADTQPPTTPTNLTASPGSPTSVNLSWSASTDNVAIAGYEIYRGQGSATPTLLATTNGTGTTFTDSTVSANTTYTYRVLALDTANPANKSTQSAPATATTPTTPDTTAPTVAITAPTANATVSGKTITITAAATDNVAVRDVQLYLDYSGDPSTNKLGPLFTSPASGTPADGTYSYTWDTTTLGNGPHTLTAIATDTSSNTKLATTLTVNVNNQPPVVDPGPDTTPPSIPTGLSSTGITESSATIFWLPSTDPTKSGELTTGVASYNVYRNNTLLTNTTTLAIVDAGLTPDTNYSYQVTSLDNAGNESAKTQAIDVKTAKEPEPQPEPEPEPDPEQPPLEPPPQQPQDPNRLPVSNPNKARGDLNGDNKVTVTDLSILLSNYGKRTQTADLNNDTIVNVTDLSILLSNYGR